MSVPERKEATGWRRRRPGKRRKEGGGAWASGKRRDKTEEGGSVSLRSRSGTEGWGLGRLLKRPCSAVLPDFTSKNVETSETNVKTE